MELNISFKIVIKNEKLAY